MYIVVDMENVLFGELMYGFVGVGFKCFLVVIEFLYKIYGEDKLKFLKSVLDIINKVCDERGVKLGVKLVFKLVIIVKDEVKVLGGVEKLKIKRSGSKIKLLKKDIIDGLMLLVFRLVMEENLVLGVVLEGLKRIFLIDEEEI